MENISQHLTGPTSVTLASGMAPLATIPLLYSPCCLTFAVLDVAASATLARVIRNSCIPSQAAISRSRPNNSTRRPVGSWRSGPMRNAKPSTTNARLWY